MPSDLVETCVAHGAKGAALRASSASEEPTREGTRVRFVFDAAAGADAALAAHLAGLDPLRVVEAVSSGLEAQRGG